MTNWYSVFYWLTVADGVKKFFDTSSNVFTTLAVLTFIFYLIVTIGKGVQVSSSSNSNEDDDKTDADTRAWEILRKYATRFMWPMIILSIITWAGYVATPTKKDCMLIIAGGSVGHFMSTDSSAKQLPADVTKFLHVALQNEIKGLSDSTRKELGFSTPKEKLADKLKGLTKEQIIDFVTNDSTAIK